MNSDPPSILPVTAARRRGRLAVAGHDVAALAARHGTPLYLYDEATLDDALAAYCVALAAHWPGESAVAYAAKAWLSAPLVAWAAARGLGMDVVSEGELDIALAAGLPAASIHAHGNNKSDAFLRACLAHRVGRVVIDHAREAERLAALAAEAGARQGVWLRLNPATAAPTHASIETGSATSKFGLSLSDGSAWRAARTVHESPWLDWRGVHFHIGSQIADPAPFVEATRRVLGWLGEVKEALGWTAAEFSPGGGWAVPYLPGDPHLPPDVALPPITTALLDGFAALGAPPPRLVLEPGRELVARAGVALYTVGALKQAGPIRYAFLDGGMADNPRPALYGARYTALLANRAGRGRAERYTLAGPFCESGDVLGRDVMLPPLREGDLLAVPVSGAYQLSMASRYNAAPPPTVLWLRVGEQPRLCS